MARRLAAILAADVVGYSSLMNDDETGTLAALKAHRAEVFDPVIAERGGRLFLSYPIPQRPPPPATFEEALDTVNAPTLSPRMKEALAFVATENPAEKKLERPHAASLEALERRGLIFLSSTDDDCSLTDTGRRAFEAIRSG